MSTTAPGDSAAGPSRGITIATGAPAASAASSATRAEPLAGQHRVHHLQVDGAQALDERRRGGRRPGRPRSRPDRGLAPTPSYACAAKSGWACSVSSPDSPVRIL